MRNDATILNPKKYNLNKLVVPLLLGVGIIATLGREILFAKYFGTGREIEIYRLAFAGPNMFSQSLAPAVIAAIIPMIVETENKGDLYKQYFIKQVLIINFIGAITIAGIGIATAPFQATILAPGFEIAARGYLTSQIAIMWIFFLCMYLTFGIRAILYNHGIFWQGISSNLIVSLVFLTGFLLIQNIMGAKYLTAKSLSIIAIIAGAIVFCTHVIQNPTILKWDKIRAAGVKYSYYSFSAIFFSIAGVTIYKVSNTIPRFIDRSLSTQFTQGIVASLEYSYNILNVPGIILATSFATVFYPTFVKIIKKSTDIKNLKKMLRIFLIILFISTIIGTAIFIWSEELVKIAFQRGKFDISSVKTTSIILKWQGLGLTGMVGGIILSQAILGFRAIKLLILIAAIKILVKFASLKYLVDNYGIAGLGGSFAVTENSIIVILLAVLIFKLKKRKPLVA